MQYLHWQEIVLQNPTYQEINSKYEQGFVFIRKAKNLLQQTRSLRINLAEFTLSSENRRVLKKVEKMQLKVTNLPLAINNYDWKIHSLGKNFYQQKFGAQVFTANKIKQLLTDEANSNFNLLLHYQENENTVGYCITYENQDLIHYAYPFYDISKYTNNYGMGMMLQAILYAQEKHKLYCYLGSATKELDKYKLQFKGLQWFNGKNWQTDLLKLKSLLTNNQI